MGPHFRIRVESTFNYAEDYDAGDGTDIWLDGTVIS